MDNHFGEPIASLFAGHRYTGGYQTDWGGGGYRLNVVCVTTLTVRRYWPG